MQGLVGRSEVEHLGGKVLVIQAIVKVGGGKAIGMALESVRLLDLAAIWQTNVVDAKVVFGIVRVWRDLAWWLSVKFGRLALFLYVPQYWEMMLKSDSKVVF